MAMRQTAPTLRPIYEIRALPRRVSDAEARRLGLSIVMVPSSSRYVRVRGRYVRARDQYVRLRDVWLEQPIDDRWMAAYRIVTSGGRPRLAELRIFPLEDWERRPRGEWSGVWKGVDAAAPRQSLTKAVLRRVRPHLWTTQTRAILTWIGQQPGGRQRLDVLARFGLPVPAMAPQTSGSRRGRPPRPDEFYARIAAEYVAALRASRRPIKTIAEKRHEPEPRVRGWIHRARRRGLLEGGGQGTTHGQLSQRAIFLLEALKQTRRPRRRVTRRKK